MTPSPNLLTLLETEEGEVLHPYMDEAGVWTIGYGTTYYPDGRKVGRLDSPITRTQAIAYMQHDIQFTVNFVNRKTSSIHLTQNQFDALISFVYNIGGPGFATSTVLRLLLVNPKDPAIFQAFQLWNKITVKGRKVVSKVLTARRMDEAQLYFKP